MKATTILLLFLSSYAVSQAQTIYGFDYKVEVARDNGKKVKVTPKGEVHVRSNKDFIEVHCNDVPARQSYHYVLDVKDKVRIGYTDDSSAYMMDEIDSVFRSKTELSRLGTETVGDAKCRIYKGSGENMTCTIWMDESVPVQGPVDSFLYSTYPVYAPVLYGTYMDIRLLYSNAPTNGLIRKILCAYDGSSDKYSYTYTLIASYDQPVSAAALKAPWMDPSKSPAIPCTKQTKSMSGNYAYMFTPLVVGYEPGNADKYMLQQKKLYQKVTGKVPDAFQCFFERHK
ncbi:MAG: hypothetical protein JST83_03290 [Bacteroidetes bacterium]|nr:hypothetical protein [Bacteroidota bacterium]